MPNTTSKMGKIYQLMPLAGVPHQYACTRQSPFMMQYLQDVTGITSYVWDSDSRKIAVLNPTGINLTSTLDPVGNRLVLQDSFGTTSYSWDQQARLLSIWNPLNERTSLTWDPLDREQHRVLANGGTISHTWDAAGRETLIENRNAAGLGQFVATNTYSLVNNRLTVVELDNTQVTYSYDASSQIVSESRSGTYAYARSYVWDPLGNRLQQYDSGVLTTSTFNAANQLLVVTPTTGTPTVSSYDTTGNLILQSCGTALTTQTWTPQNRLASYSDPAGNSDQFLYSDDGLKKQRIVGATTTLFTYDETALLLETNTSNVVQARYTNSPETWGGLASQNRSGVSSFYGFDSQMSARILVSIAGVITDLYSYKAFGEELQSGSGTVNPYRFGALVLYYRELVDLINAWNRWLKSSVGRWGSKDKLGFDSGSWNPYGYVGNNPVVLIDPTGLDPATCCQLRCQVTSEPVLLTNLDIVGDCVATYSRLATKCSWMSPDLFCAVFDDEKCRQAAAKYGASLATVCGAALTERSWEFVGLAGHFQVPLNWLKGVTGAGASVGCLEFRVPTALAIVECLSRRNPGMAAVLGAPRTGNAMREWLKDCSHEYELLAAWAWLYESGNGRGCGFPNVPGGDFGDWYNRHNKLWRERYKCAINAIAAQ